MDTIRNLIPASARSNWYAVASAIVAALVAWGVLDSQAAAAVTGVAAAVVTLLFAVLHATSPWRQAVYGLAAALAVLFAYLGYGSGAQWDSILAVLAPVLGLGVAAAYTPAGEDTPADDVSSLA